MALSYFTDQKVALAVIEVGMGGRLDATNIFIPVLSIITNIGLEHTNYLGRRSSTSPGIKPASSNRKSGPDRQTRQCLPQGGFRCSKG
jgi:hypothetical protein